MDRYQIMHYAKRINQNRAFKEFLIKKIVEHGADLELETENLQYLNYEDLLEIAIASVNKSINITLGAGKDFDNGFDAKAVIVRTNSRGRRYSGGVKCKFKKACYAVLYENIQDKFYFFALPTDDAVEVDIPFSHSGQPKRSNKWWRYECESFEDMCSYTIKGYKKNPADALFDFG